MRKKLIQTVCALFVCIAATAQEETSHRKSTEDAFIAKMKEYAQRDLLGRVSPDTTVLGKVEGKDYYVLPGETYIIDEISSATYYTHVDEGFLPLCDKRFPAETIANRLLLPNCELPDGCIKLTFRKYRYKTDSVNIHFKQFYQFYTNEHYEAYIGIESKDSKEMKVDLFLYNARNKWMHVFVLDCTTQSVADDGLTVKGDAWLFIPTSNLRNLMGKELPKDFMQKLLNKTKK